MSVCHGLCERIQFLDDAALRTTVQPRLCSISHCRSALIPSKTPTGRSGWWGGGLNVHPALNNDCPPLCSLTVISSMRNSQIQRGKVAKCTQLCLLHPEEWVSLKTGISKAKQNTLENTLFSLHFHLFAIKTFHNPESTAPLAFKYLLWISCYSVMNIFSPEVCPLSPEKEFWKK